MGNKNDVPNFLQNANGPRVIWACFSDLEVEYKNLGASA